MTDRRLEGPGEHGAPIPRDMPDQQAGAADGGWGGTRPQGSGDDDNLPSPDEAGARRQGEERSDTVHPEHPDPQESTD
ncbi:hypothetical protein ACIQKE_11330 [Streptomyces griseoviridis]|uniref:Uncharacterized protein n=2 Tax=Streptomyces TaxID=1883 RepID=A0A3S9Z5L0_STRGD|nr:MULTISPECIES: hypothetical protein [Streptomyces]AZS83083.1 hypothetical protein ELQ87_01320 [Streptomyces griseoviridis]MDH6695806.1 hypothetical protein [Streptomyces sp. MAA16]MDT0470558.1 hypothetical protein [Streptomyces sp. DSM 41014]QCN90064.1 hypothetical protein DDJ31_38040 [Streptomyces griseoviridis]